MPKRDRKFMVHANFNVISQALANLSVLELEELMKQIVTVRKQKLPTVLSATESDLLKNINRPLPKTLQKRYHFLLKKRYAETLTENEFEELLELTAFQEAHTTKRLGYVLELAKLRSQTLDEVLVELEIKPRFYVV